MTPRILFQSFMLVAGAYIAHLVLLFIVANVAFPDSMAIITGEPAEFQKIVESEPERVYPESMAWVLMLASSVVCFGLGAAVARLAPISSFSHVLFFAAILFFSIPAIGNRRRTDLEKQIDIVHGDISGSSTAGR